MPVSDPHEPEVSPAQVTRLQSRYADHELLGPLVTSYLAALPADWQALSAAYHSGNLKVLGQLCHRLVGDAATYGFDALSAAARCLETAALQADQEALCRHFAALKHQIVDPAS